MGFVKKVKKARHKLRAKARGLTVVELAELEVLKKATEKRERMKHKRWEIKEKVKRKYRRKREMVTFGGGGGNGLEKAKKVWGWLQTHGEHAQRRIESGYYRRGRRPASFEDLADIVVFGPKKKRRR